MFGFTKTSFYGNKIIKIFAQLSIIILDSLWSLYGGLAKVHTNITRNFILVLHEFSWTCIIEKIFIKQCESYDSSTFNFIECLVYNFVINIDKCLVEGAIFKNYLLNFVQEQIINNDIEWWTKPFIWFRKGFNRGFYNCNLFGSREFLHFYARLETEITMVLRHIFVNV